MPPIYLDYNAGAPLDPLVLEVFVQALQEEIGNPSSIHFHGKEAKRKLNESRRLIASYFNVRPQEIVFTSGGTEAACLLIQGFMGRYPKGHIISSQGEHACVYENIKALENRGCSATYLPIGEKGAPDPLELERAIRSETRLIVLIGANNETGVLTDIPAMAEVAKKARVPLVVDAVAWLGKAPLEISEGVSAVFFSGHKIGAPKGIGWGVCKTAFKCAPLLLGGGQELGRRAGTENLPAIVALAKAIALLTEKQASSIAHMKRIRDFFEQELIRLLPFVVRNGEGLRVSNTSNLSFTGLDGESLLIHLDLAGVSASHGSACSSGAIEPSRILQAMGFSQSRVESSLRFSFGREQTQEEIERAIEVIARVAKEMKKSA